MLTVIFTLIIGGLALYFLAGLVWNFVYCMGWVVYWVWCPIDWLLHRERRYVPRRSLDY